MGLPVASFFPDGLVREDVKSLPNFAAYDGNRVAHSSGTATAPPFISVITVTKPVPSACVAPPSSATVSWACM